MKRSVKKIICVLICILIMILILVGVYFYSLTPVSNNKDIVKFTVESGSNTKSVINSLYDAKIIRSKFATLIYAKLNSDLMVKAGTYELDRSFDTKKVLDTICNGDALHDTIKVTFTEGKKVSDYAKVISNKFGYSYDDVINVMNDKSYLKELINKYDFITDDILNSDIYYPLEGYLYPDTYEFYKDASVKTIIEKMIAKTKNVLDNINTSSSGKSVHEILTIASIIENETKYPEDRSIVSQVIYKRLAINMSLGMDVTTYYAVKKEMSESLTQSDLNSVNGYNTRNTSFIGLPVGPICNPRKEAIEAALNPSNTNYIYFYADVYGKGGKAGKLYFAENYSEFQNLIRKYS